MASTAVVMPPIIPTVAFRSTVHLRVYVVEVDLSAFIVFAALPPVLVIAQGSEFWAASSSEFGILPASRNSAYSMAVVAADAIVAIEVTKVEIDVTAASASSPLA